MQAPALVRRVTDLGSAGRGRVGDVLERAWEGFSRRASAVESVAGDLGDRWREAVRWGEPRERALAVAATPLLAIALLALVVATAVVRLAGLLVAALVLLLIAAVAIGPVVAAAWAISSATTGDPQPTTGHKVVCEAGYVGVCIPAGRTDYDCPQGGGDWPYAPRSNFKVTGSDPEHFDGDHDGIGCETH